MVLAFEGWNDAGEAATTVLRFVSDAIRSVPLAEIDSEEFYDFTVRRPNVVLDHTRTRRVVWPENHFRYGSVERWIRSASPQLGEHNREVLMDLGLDDAEIERLKEAEVIGDRPKGL